MRWSGAWSQVRRVRSATAQRRVSVPNLISLLLLLRPAERFMGSAQGFFFSSAFCVPSGIEGSSASTSLATVSI